MRRLLKIVFALGVIGVLFCAVGVGLFYAFIIRDLPEIYSLQDYRPKLITRVLDRNGDEIATFSTERRIIVPIEEIPQHVVQAFVAAEDAAFYDHEGLDYPGILRAAMANLRAGSVKQGGSTITQQVAKTFLLSNERSYVRKLKDMVLAMRIEKSLNKNEILYLYLNQIYLGSGAYGVEAAAQNYFGKSIRDLQVEQAALIAGLVPAPSLWTPFRDLKTATRKQRGVLSRMVKNNYLTAEEKKAAVAAPLGLRSRDWTEVQAASSYFVEEVRRYLFDTYGSEKVLTGGLTVRTTLEPDRQLEAYQAVRRGLRAHDQRLGYRGPIRNVPPAEWDSVRAAIAETNADVRVAEEQLYRALVTSLDDAAGQALLSLGGELETTLAFKDVSWARKVDPTIDGIAPQIKSVSQALHLGDLVWLARESDTYALYQKPLAEGSLLAVELESSYLQAMIGGYSFERSEFNRALQSRRQPGSAFKPFVYAAALETGYTPASIVHDTAIVYEDRTTGLVWKPENYSDKFYGPITLRHALAKSRNVATIKILSDIGLPPVQRMARKLGIVSKLEANLGLALGNSELTLAELVRGYTTFAAGGKLIDPIFILEVRDRAGELLESNITLLASQVVDDAGDVHEPPADVAEEQAIDPALEPILPVVHRVPPAQDARRIDAVTAYLMTDMLRAVVENGTGRRVRALKRPVAGKTGTTNDLHDAWFVGYTPNVVAGVWVGYDNAHNLGKNETGSRTASPIFLDYMKSAHRGRSVRDFHVPNGVVFARINPKTGLRARPGDQEAVFQPFREGTAPQEMSPPATQTSRPRLD